MKNEAAAALARERWKKHDADARSALMKAVRQKGLKEKKRRKKKSP